MRQVVCNYAIIRFRPYPESGEFVNVGVVASCPQTGELAFKVEKKKFARVTHFFPELDRKIYKVGLQTLVEELERLQTKWGKQAMLHRPTTPEEIKQEVARFRDLVRPRETLFRFSDIRTLLCPDLAKGVQDLFDRYVERMFAQAPEYQEIVMQRRLGRWLKEWDVNHLFRQTQVGSDAFHVTFPFVRKEEERVVTAIKPLDLAKPDPNQIFEHGDMWVSRMKRLSKFEVLPERTLFPVKTPDTGIQQSAANEVLDELAGCSGVIIVPFENREDIRKLVVTG